MSYPSGCDSSLHVPEGTVIYFSHRDLAVNKYDHKLFVFEVMISFVNSKYEVAPIFVHLENASTSNIGVFLLDSIDEVATYLKVIVQLFEPMDCKLLIFDQKYEDKFMSSVVKLWRTSNE